MIKSIIILMLFLSNAIVFAATNTELERRINILAEEIETMKLKQKSPKASKWFGLGQSASGVYNIAEGLSIGGYGEITLTMPGAENEAGTKNTAYSQGEALRNVLYIGYKYSDKWILNTEIELEHVDQVFVEFAYVDYLASDSFNWRTGLVLIPMGLVNESHEPIYFNSVNRPEVEKYIIPSTWRELGTGAYGQIGKFSYKAFVVNGLDAEGFSTSGVRSGRKKGGVSGGTNDKDISTVAAIVRADFQVSDEIMIGAAAYNGSASSVNYSPIGIGIYQLHTTINIGNAYAKALYAKAMLDDVKEFNTASSSSIAEQMQGYYIEGGYSIMLNKARVTPFIRYEEVDTQNKMTTGTTASKSKILTNTTMGIAFAPIDRIVFKFDYMKKQNEAKTGVNEIHASLGYLF